MNKKSKKDSVAGIISILCASLIGASKSIIKAVTDMENSMKMVLLVTIALAVIIAIAGYAHYKSKKRNDSDIDPYYSYSDTKKAEYSAEPPKSSAKESGSMPDSYQNTPQMAKSNFIDISKEQWKRMYKDGLVTYEEYNDHIEKFKHGG